MQNRNRLRIGFEISKAIGVCDGLGRYARMLLRSLVEAGLDDEFWLYDVHRGGVDETRVRQLFPQLPPNVRLCGATSPRSGDVHAFHSPAFDLPRRNPCPLVFTLPDLTFISHPEFHTLENRFAAVVALAEAACVASEIIAISDYTKAQAVELLELPDERIQVIHLAADPSFRRLAGDDRRTDLERRLGLDRGYILTVGSLEPRKNTIGLIEAVASLPVELTENLSLAVVGPEGWLNRDIRERLQAASRDLHIRNLGYVEDGDLAALYSFAEVFVYPSFTEGFGLPVLEAMACGAPVVSSNSSAIPEVAGDAALLVDPHDSSAIANAIERALSDESLRLELRRRGLERAAGFSWQRTAEQTMEVYRRVAG
jgi:glycosyltransferase involved in cell wall biosynthesis